MDEASQEIEKKYYTPAEANLTLPLVRRIVSDIQETGQRLFKQAEELGEAAAEDTGIKKMIDTLNEFFAELEQLGCSYKDPNFKLGLVDFPALIEGKEVELCWRSDEPSVAFYHGQEGYAGRKPIPEKYLIEGGGE
ncbi:MAG: DUF2203 domain-containing protein [bacterium]|nr:DUF2203 domain-containing protein [bacterium]